MGQNYDTIIINSDRSERAKVLHLVEEVCDKFNLHNYFGIFSVAIDEILDLVFKNNAGQTTISFEQCVGGACFSAKSENAVFSNNSELIEMLTNGYEINDEGKSIDLIFYVDGIDASELTSRQNRLKEYFKIKGSANCTLSSKRRIESSSL